MLTHKLKVKYNEIIRNKKWKNRMKLKQMIIFAILLLFTVSVYAHGDEDHSSQSIIDIIRNISTNQLIVLGTGIVAACIFAGIIWFLAGKQMPAMLILATVLTVYTGIIHLVVGRTGDWLLVANGAGFCAIAVLRGLPIIRLSTFNKKVTAGLLVYTIITFIGYFLTHTSYDIYGIAAKLTEVILFVILLRDLLAPSPVEDVVLNSSTSPAVN